MDPQPPTSSNSTARSGAGGGWYAAICFGSTVPFLLTLALGPRSGLEALIIIVPWLVMVLVHLVAGPLTLYRSWHAKQEVLLGCASVYVILFVGAHLWLWVEATELPSRLQAQYEEARHPNEVALQRAVSSPHPDVAQEILVFEDDLERAQKLIQDFMDNPAAGTS